MSSPHIYLAGPDVFLPNATTIGAAKCSICAEQGLFGVFPLDNEPLPAGLSRANQARHISLANEALMRSCDAIIANMTPFRGAAMDSGTAYEVGFMRALGKPVFGYTNTTIEYAERARAVRQQGLTAYDYDAPDVEIEDFGLTENLMIAVAVSETGPAVVKYDAPTDDAIRQDLAGFREATQHTAQYFLHGTAPA